MTWSPWPSEQWETLARASCSPCSNTSETGPSRRKLNSNSFKTNDESVLDLLRIRYLSVAKVFGFYESLIGSEIKFQINAPGHPFYLKIKSGIGKKNLIQGVENNGLTEGEIIWIPKEKGIFYYQCGKHKNMVGIIKII